MKIGVYPGSFDPVTNGHLDIIERSSKMVDKLIVGVLHNPNKVAFLDIKTRVELLKKVTADLENVEVYSFDGLLVDFVKNNNATIIIRGFRAISDFEYELQLAQTNMILNSDIETIFLPSKVKYAYVSSSIVRELHMFNGDFSKLVPKEVVETLKKQKK